jgi:polyphenol oxidase
MFPPRFKMPMTAVKRQAFQLIAREGVEWLECDLLSRIPWLRHAFSTRVLRPTRDPSTMRAAGSDTAFAGLNLGLVEGDRQARIESNRRLFFDRLGVGTLAFAGLRQIHSSLVHYARTESAGTVKYNPSGYTPAQAASDGPPCGDALVTDQPGILLSVCTADCVPLLLVDPARRVIAAVHAGWRGSLQCIAEKTVGEMRRVFHSQPEELLAAVGPSIRACCYDVGQDVMEAFCGRFPQCEDYFKEPPLSDAARTLKSRDPLLFLSVRPPAHGPDTGTAARLDLVAVTRNQLRNAGLRSNNIRVASFCTACRTDLFFSHRKEGTTGRMMAVIGMI